MKRGKVAIVGAGSVGSTIAYTLSVKGLVTDIALIDLDLGRAAAETQDILHGVSLGSPLKVASGGYEAAADAEVAVITAGAKQRPGESRVGLADRNVKVTRGIVHSSLAAGFRGIFLVITNPVDVLTWVAWKSAAAEAEVPPSRVIGSGTVLDSSRLRHFLSEHCRINPINVHGYVLGEHGDTSFPAWSLTSVGGVNIAEYCPRCGQGCEMGELELRAREHVRGAAQQIIAAKGATSYGIAQAASVILQAILRDERRILTVSTVREGWKGLRATAFSVPTIVGAGGAEEVLDLPLSSADEQSLLASASYVASVIDSVGA